MGVSARGGGLFRRLDKMEWKYGCGSKTGKQMNSTSISKGGDENFL